MAGRDSRRGAVAYLAIAAVQRGTTFLMLPLFARALTPEEYGRIAVLLTVYGLVTVAIPGGLELPLFRAMFAPETDADRSSQLASLVTALFVGPLVAGAVLGALAWRLPSLFTMDPGQLALYLITAGTFVAGTMATHTILRAQERFGSYATMILGYTVVNTTLRAWLVLIEDRGVPGWILADLGAAVFALALGLVWQRQHLSLRRARRAQVAAGLRVGLPLVPHQASHWGLSLSDRLVVAAYSTPALVGIYGLASQIALVSALLVTELSRAYMPRYGEAVHESDHSHLQPIVRQQAILIFGLCGLTAVLGASVVNLALPEAYADAAELVPWVALGSVLLGLYYIPMNLLTVAHGKTRGVWLYSLAGATVNLSLNVLLVPRFGLIAAAVDTAAGYLVLLGLVLRAAHRAGAMDGIDVPALARPVLPLAGIAALFSTIAVRGGAVGATAAVTGSAALVLLSLIELRRSRSGASDIAPGPTGALRA